MRTTKILSLVSAMALLTVSCIAESSQTTNSQELEWTNRLELTAEQQQLLHIYAWLDDASNPPEKRQHLEADAKRISDKLGPASVRHAKPGELIVTHDKSGVAKILNPSEDNVAFTVSVHGDEQRMGTRMASMGRLTFLPPKGTLRVSNMYWTTPRMMIKN